MPSSRKHMTSLPRGLVTLLFTDVEGSTKLLQELGSSAYVSALDAHRRTLRDVACVYNGVEVEMQGDSFHFAFAKAVDGVAAAAAAQRALTGSEARSQPLRIRIGLNT